MRIVHVAPNHEPIPPAKDGGTERIVYALCEYQTKLGHEVFLYAPMKSSGSAQIIHYPFITQEEAAIEQYVMNSLIPDIDIIHDHTFHSVIGTKGLSIPTVCTLHLPNNNAVKYPIYLSNRALQVIGGGYGEFVYNGINIRDYPFDERKEDYLLFIGRVIRQKGILQAIKVAKRTGRRLIIAGPIHEYDFFKSEVEPRIRALPNVEYVGPVGGEVRNQLLKNAGCVLFPSIWEEPFGLVMVEAMACGTMVLALNSGSVSEVMAGFPDLICHSLEEMVEKVANPPAIEAHALRKYVSDHFSIDKMGMAYMNIYDRLAKEHKSEARFNDEARQNQYSLANNSAVFFTVITLKRLHEARIMVKSVKNHHPDSVFVLCLVEDEPSPAAQSDPNIDELILARDLGIPNFHSFIFKYDENDAPRAIKGEVFQYLMDKYADYSNFVFLDSAMFVTSCLHELLEHLNGGASIVLTPHHSMPSVTWDCWGEIGTLKDGVFNSGLIAVSRSSESERFIKWLCARLERFCFEHQEMGFFHDQKWLNLAPAFFDVTVMRHAGYNMAAWNLHERKLFCGPDGTITVNKLPLRCINFTNDNGMMDVCMNLYVHDKHNPLYEMKHIYFKWLEQAGKINVTWSYSLFHGGERISEKSRKKYRNNLEFEHSFPDPFVLTNSHFS